MQILEKAHSKLGASSTDRWFECPASVKLSETMPPLPPTIFAREGTVAHWLMEKVLTEPPNAFWYVGQIVDEFTITEEMAGHVQEFCDLVRDKVNELKGELFVEKKFHLPHIHEACFGTADVVIVQPFGEVWVLDFKYGANVPVEVENNSQLLFYALGATYGEDFSKLMICVVQPRAHHDAGHLRSWECSAEKLKEFSIMLRQKALATQLENPPFKSGDHCRWCRAQGVCPELYKKSLEIAQTDFANPVLPDVKALTNSQIAQVVEHRKLIESWFDAVEQHALGVLLSGEKVDGLKLVQKRSRRIWADEKRAESFLSAKLGEGAFERKLLSVPQAEKVLGKNVVVGLFQTLDTGVTIAHESDRRKAVVSAKDSFSVIETTGQESISSEDF